MEVSEQTVLWAATCLHMVTCCHRNVEPIQLRNFSVRPETQESITEERIKNSLFGQSPKTQDHLILFVKAAC